MNTWTPLWSGIVDSSLWEEDGDVVKVFVTMLATKDSDHVCRLDAYKIAKKCNFTRANGGGIDEVKVLEILKILASPDKRRQTPQEFDGRRIEAVDDGWLILNGEKYRQMVAEEMRKARLRRAQNAFRQRKKDGATLRQYVKQQVDTDPITKRDSENHKKRYATNPKRVGKSTGEYDQDFEPGASNGNHAGEDQAAVGGGPGDANGSENLSGEGTGVSGAETA